MKKITFRETRADSITVEPDKKTKEVTTKKTSDKKKKEAN